MRFLKLRIAAFAALLALTSGVQATNILELRYDEKLDQLVMKVAYRGSHADHHFTLSWDSCSDYGFDDAEHQISAGLIDSDPNDRALQEYTKTVKVSLDSLECRPAKVTVRASPNFFRSVIVPKRPERAGKPTPAEAEAEVETQ
jgi:hypothetical protein